MGEPCFQCYCLINSLTGNQSISQRPSVCDLQRSGQLLSVPRVRMACDEEITTVFHKQSILCFSFSTLKSIFVKSSISEATALAGNYHPGALWEAANTGLTPVSWAAIKLSAHARLLLQTQGSSHLKMGS